MHRLRRPLLLLRGMCLGGCVACGLIAFGLSMVKHGLSDVPFNQVVFERDGAYYYRPTGGDPDKRPKFEISRDQFLGYRQYEAQARLWARPAAVFFLCVVVLTAVLSKDRRPADGASPSPERPGERPPANPPMQRTGGDGIL